MRFSEVWRDRRVRISTHKITITSSIIDPQDFLRRLDHDSEHTLNLGEFIHLLRSFRLLPHHRRSYQNAYYYFLTYRFQRSKSSRFVYPLEGEKMTETGQGTFTREGLPAKDPLELSEEATRLIVKDLLWEYTYEAIGDMIRQELELFFMRRDPLFQRVLREITEGKK